MLLASLAGTALAALTVAVTAADTPAWERRLTSHFATGGTGWQVISDASGTWPMLLAAAMGAVVLWFARLRASALFLFAAVAVTAALSPVLKGLVDRERPDVVPLPAGLSPSYPSGHTAASGALLLAAVLVVHRLVLGDRRVHVPVALTAEALAALVALSQLVLGRHYPTDLLAGWLLAATVVLGISALRAWLSPRLDALRAARG